MTYSIYKGYLKANRLSDISRLIAVLGIDENYSFRKNEGLDITLNGKPNSGIEWFEIAKEHPEFFKLNTDSNSIILLFRFLKRVKVGDNYEYPKLSVEETQKIIDQAVTLHDKQISRFQLLIPIYLALLALIVNLWPNNELKIIEEKLNVITEIIKHK